MGAWCLQKHNGGSGVLLPGLDGVPPGKVVILGAGNVGANALAIAYGIGAWVTVFAKTERRFAALKESYPDVVYRTGCDPQAIVDADLVIGGVLTPGQLSPKLITRDTLRRMRPGAAECERGAAVDRQPAVCRGVDRGGSDDLGPCICAASSLNRVGARTSNRARVSVPDWTSKAMV